MSTYLLLRNNKQSGPYNFEEIRAMGVKAYDLVWVEGRSAAWRYPCEIDEFKSFAPVVEEQPFDRFFKKAPTVNQSLTNKPANLVKQSAVSSEETYFPIAAASKSTVSQPVKNIYASLPSGEKENSPTEPDKKENEKNQKLHPSTYTRDSNNNTNEPSQKTYARSLTSPQFESAPVVLEEKFSQPLDEIKKQYVEKVLNSKKNSVQIFHFFKPVAIAIGILILFGGGLFMGLYINKRGNITPGKDNSKDETVASGQQTVYRSRVFPESTFIPERPTDKPVDDNFIQESNQLADKKEIRPVNQEKKKMKPVSRRTSALANILKNKPATDSDITALGSEQRHAIHRTDAIVAKDAVKNNISDYVLLSASKYNIGAFGGISDLQLTISNRSLYPLDLVMVEVQYIQTNKKVFKTENIYFRNIRAGSALMQEAPKSPRGINVTYRIAIINSKELGLTYSGL